ncbi:MAG: prephenate dehydratase [Thermoplasmataceae archaeon]
MKIAYLGPAGTWSCVAASLASPESTGVPASSFQDVIRLTENGITDFGILPIENSVEGPVPEVLDMLLETQLVIISEHMICIRNALLSNSSSIKRIYSHHQAIAQCRNNIRRLFPDAEIAEVNSTAERAGSLSAEHGEAVIGSAYLARFYGLRVIAENLNDYPLNVTRFVILGRNGAMPTKRDKTSISFVLLNDGPGSLVRALSIFSNRGVNLSMVISRPEKKDPGVYRFFVDADMHALDPKSQPILNELKSLCREFTIKGSYPKADWNAPVGCMDRDNTTDG